MAFFNKLTAMRSKRVLFPLPDGLQQRHVRNIADACCSLLLQSSSPAHPGPSQAGVQGQQA